MFLFLITCVVDYLIAASLVGVTWSAILRSRGVTISPRMRFASLLAIFAILDLYWWPAALSLEITFTVGNSQLARLLELHPNMGIEQLLDIGPFDFLVWVLQVLVALWVGPAVVGSPESPAV
jgi:hypothetical protein